MRLTWDFWRVPCWAARFKKRPIVWTIWSRLTRWELCDLLRLCAETKRKTSTAYLMNDNKLPIVTLKVCCENVQKANKAHVSFIMEEFFFFFFCILAFSLWNNPWKMSLVAFTDCLLWAVDADVQWILEYTASEFKDPLCVCIQAVICKKWLEFEGISKQP